jgi:hypothetical protein
MNVFVIFRALRLRSFALLWGGQTVSSLGDSLFQVALAWWATDRIGPSSVFIIGGVLQTAILERIPN